MTNVIFYTFVQQNLKKLNLRIDDRQRGYNIYGIGDKSGDADDSGFGIFLWRTGKQKEHPQHHDAKFCLAGIDHCTVVQFRLFTVFQWHFSEWH